MTNKDQCREAFEKHVLAPNGFYENGAGWVARNADGTYRHENIQARWTAWQAARSAPAAPVELPQGDGWLPIESAPKDGSEILLVSRKGRIANGCWMTANDRRGTWMWPYVMVEPTHWMPLPQPPKEQT